MKMTKNILSILLACVMLMSAPTIGVCAAGTQDDPIDAATKWFGYGVDCYLLNPSIAEGSDGMWYTLTAEQDGILALEHKYKNVDYTITITVNGQEFVGGSVDGVIYNGPIMTLPLQVGDVATTAIVTKAAAAGTVYASMTMVAGDLDNSVKVKSEGIDVYVAAGQTVYFQDDSLQASYATKGLLVEGNVADTTFYTVTKNAESGTATKKAYTDTDKDGVIEATLGGSQGSAGAPAVKPAWAIQNNSAEAQKYTLTIAAGKVHECVYTDDTDADCNSCGAIRDLCCQHVYDHDFDADCNLCGDVRFGQWSVVPILGTSVSEDVNGLAVQIKANIGGIQVDGKTAIYDEAFVNEFKLVGMGAVVSNDGSTPSMETVDNNRVLNIPAVYLSEFEPERDSYYYTIRIVNIPENQKNTVITFRSYFIYEDYQGNQHVIYDSLRSFSYNEAR